MKTKTGKGTENKTDIESILKELTGDGIKGCYLLYGEDEYTRRKAEERLKRVVVDEASVCFQRCENNGRTNNRGCRDHAVS